jgi:hypothetical protein
MKKAVIGILQTEAQAESVLQSLTSAGFATHDISVLFPDSRGSQDFAHEHATKAPEGAIAGVGAGSVLGGTLGLLAGIGALAIPGIGPFIAAGPLMATLGGVAAGAAVGGLTGALVGMGIPEMEAKLYEGKIRDGNLLLAVHVENAEERKRAEDILKQAGARDIDTTSEARVPGETRSERR